MSSRDNRTYFVLALVWLFACGDKSASSKPQPAVQELTQAPAPAASKPTGTLYPFSQDNSKIEFVGANVTMTNKGSFKTFSGRIQLPAGEATAAGAAAKVEIAASSLQTDIDKLTAHLKSPDFFDVAKFPSLRFTSTAVTAQSGSTYNIAGNLELHGITKPINFPATIRLTPQQVEADAEFTIYRKDFGIIYPGMPDNLIKDEVQIKLTIRAPHAGS